jgi:two-component system chemotaxis response regulator CheB
LFKTYEALAAGAVDVLDKPSGTESDTAWERTFVSTIKLISRVPVITHPRARLPEFGRTPAAQPVQPAPLQNPGRNLIAIGASTGGPAALVDIMRVLPAPLPLPLLLVLHIAEPFGAAFAEWLDGQTAHRVAFAREGERVDQTAGRVVLAPPDRHVVVRHGRLHLTHDAERHSCRPSVDVLFESIAREYGATAVGCLLTGMGRDGAAGLLAMRRAGSLTIAQDEASCVVYGMPREAVLLGGASLVLPLADIGPTLSAIGERREVPRS